MELKICKFETAKALRDIGFDLKCTHVYYCDEDVLVDVLVKRINEDYDNFIVTERGCNHDYIEKGYLTELHDIANIGGNYTGDILAPTLELVKMWLREKYNIKIDVSSSSHNGLKKWVDWYCKVNNKSIIDHRDGLDSYDEALEVAINEAIKLIK